MTRPQNAIAVCLMHLHGRSVRTRLTAASSTLRARDLDLDLGSGHTAYRRASLIDLYLHTKFH